MAERVVDPTKFLLLAGIIDWRTVYRRHAERAVPATEIAKERGLELASLVQLRWVSDPALGLPTEPYTVWRRPSGKGQEEEALEPRVTRLFGWSLVILDRPYVFVRARLQVSAPAVVLAYSGVPVESQMLPPQSVAVGTQTVSFSAPAVQSLLLPTGVDLVGMSGLDDRTAEDPNWERVEIVGLPTGSDWAGVQHHDSPQGPVSSLMDPVDAALDRFRRGAPFYGWNPQLAPAIAAPPWQLADPKAMLETIHRHVLPPLRDMLLTLAAEDQHGYEVTHTLASHGGSNPATATFTPLQALIYGASTDGLASLITGFGTAFVDAPGQRERGSVPGSSSWDYMVTARYDDGTNGSREPVEYAAIIFAPGLATPPPAPTGLSTLREGLRSPGGTDEAWHGVVRVSWNALPDSMPFRVGSYAFARARQAPPGGVVPLMDVRPLDTALQPIGVTKGSEHPPSNRYAALDERYAVEPVPNPNSLLYGVAHHDLFGLYSGWSTVPFQIGEPPVPKVPLLTARFDVQNAGPGAPCPAELTIEFSWDWAVRSPNRIQFVNRLYGQAALGQPPADLSVSAGFSGTLGATASGVLAVDFDPDGTAAVSSIPPGMSALVFHLSLDGKSIVPGPVAEASPRRYRLVVSGFSLDFGLSGRIGAALWARGREARVPNREGSWTGSPLIVSTADPRPPLLVLDREFVQLTSLGDSAGEHHARLDWPAVPGAVSYFAYSSAEARFLSDRGLPDAAPSDTLAARLVRLRDAFQANPDRRSFSRVNATPVPGTSMPITLPRGSKEIHLFVVLGLSAGQIESEWPRLGETGLRKRFAAFAAPQVVVPAPPDLEISRVVDDSVVPPAYRAEVRMRTKPGAAVARIDLHRVRVPEAAIDVDSMGLAIATISGTVAPFTVSPTVSSERGVAQTIGTVRGVDPVAGSWKPVFYRAVAWAGSDDERGLFGGRSPSSVVRQVVVPPAEPPDLSALAWLLPDGTLADMRIDASTLAPVPETALGAHRIMAEVLLTHDDGSTEVLYRFPPEPIAPAVPDAVADRLDRLGTAAPAPGGSGLWRDEALPPASPGAPGRTPLHLLARRPDFGDALSARIRITDPLGRVTERTAQVPPGAPVVPPDILNPSHTTLAGRGTVLRFTTSVPDEDALGRPYRLAVRFTPRPSIPLGTPARVAVTLAEIAATRPGDNPFADRAPIPLRRQGGAGARQISAILRGRGTVEVVLTAPDGTEASLSRAF